MWYRLRSSDEEAVSHMRRVNLETASLFYRKEHSQKSCTQKTASEVTKSWKSDRNGKVEVSEARVYRVV